MKTICIEHDRCGEWDKTSYYMAPNSMSDLEIEKAIDGARDAYLYVLDHFPVLELGLAPTLEQFKDSSIPVSELARMIEQHKVNAQKNRETRALHAGSFDKHLKLHDIVPLNRDTVDVIKSVIWGHRHGQTLDY